MHALSVEQFGKLASAQQKFNEAAVPLCSESTGALPDDFTIVLDIKSDGHVGRLWRQGDSKFALCFQNLLRENFYFRPTSQPFYVSFGSGE